MLSIHNEDYEKARSLLEERIEISRKIDNQDYIAYSLQSLGWIAYLQKDYVRTKSLYSESLQLSHRIQNKSCVCEALIHVGQLIAAQGSLREFVYLLGMVDGVRFNIQKELHPFVLTETEQLIEMARVALGEEAYTAAWKVGQQMRLDEAVAYALKELQ